MAAASINKGFSVDLELVKTYHALNKDKKEAYIVCKYSEDGKKLILAEKGPAKKKNAKTYAEKNKHWEDLLSKLPDDDIRYVAIQVEFKDSKGGNRNDILLVSWSPDNANIMKKMEVEGHRAIILKCFAAIRESMNIEKREDWNVGKIVKDRLKGTLD